MIIRGGANIYPAEIEHTLILHDAVLETAVIGRPSREYGEEIMAFVVLQNEVAVTAEILSAFCRERLAPYKVPQEFHIMDALPKSGVGKILKTELAERFSEM